MVDEDDADESQAHSQPQQLSSQEGDGTGRVGEDRMAVWKAARHYLERPIELRNVAHSKVPIRFQQQDGARRADGPELEVDIVVHGPDDEDDDDVRHDMDSESVSSARTEQSDIVDDEFGKLLLVRMVNRTPLLDSSEAVACGLVQGIARKKSMWRSFGLDVSPGHSTGDCMQLQTFNVRDSDQVTPFLRRDARAHHFEDEDNDSSGCDSEDNSVSGTESIDDFQGGRKSKRKRKQKKKRQLLLPAKVRLANVLVVVQIHAEPTTLPLPTLSKGRLPIDNSAIDNALELGLSNCLKQLQKTNPSLLLTANELRVVERDARYVPAVATAIASIVCKSNSQSMVNAADTARRWRTLDGTPDRSTMQSAHGNGTECGEEEIVELIEARLRSVTLLAKLPPSKDPVHEEENNKECGDDDATSNSSDTGFGDLFSSPPTKRVDETQPSIGADSMVDGGAQSGNSEQVGNGDASDYDDWL